MRELRFSVHGVPRPKERPRKGASGKFYTPAATRSYEGLVRFFAAAAAKGCPFPTSTRLAVSLSVYWPDQRRRDIDNAAKAILDACNGILWMDDSQVDELHVYRLHDAARPRVDVTVREIATG